MHSQTTILTREKSTEKNVNTTAELEEAQEERISLGPMYTTECVAYDTESITTGCEVVDEETYSVIYDTVS